MCKGVCNLPQKFHLYLFFIHSKCDFNFISTLSINVTRTTFIQAAPFRYRSTVLSIMETMFGVGLMIGPFFGSLLYELDGFYLPFVVCGTALAVCPLFAIFCIGGTNGTETVNNTGCITDFCSGGWGHPANMRCRNRRLPQCCARNFRQPTRLQKSVRHPLCC